MKSPTRTFLAILAMASLPSCDAPNVNRAPDRWIQVIDSDRKQPVKDMPVVYQEFAPFGVIVREVLTSPHYISDQSGKAHVPSEVILKPAPGSGYVLDSRRDANKSMDELESKDTLFVRRHEDYMRWLINR